MRETSREGDSLECRWSRMMREGAREDAREGGQPECRWKPEIPTGIVSVAKCIQCRTGNFPAVLADE